MQRDKETFRVRVFKKNAHKPRSFNSRLQHFYCLGDISILNKLRGYCLAEHTPLRLGTPHPHPLHDKEKREGHLSPGAASSTDTSFKVSHTVVSRTKQSSVAPSENNWPEEQISTAQCREHPRSLGLASGHKHPW